MIVVLAKERSSHINEYLPIRINNITHGGPWLRSWSPSDYSTNPPRINNTRFAVSGDGNIMQALAADREISVEGIEWYSERRHNSGEKVLLRFCFCFCGRYIHAHGM